MEGFDEFEGCVGGWVLKLRHDHDFFKDMFISDDYQKRYMLITTTKLLYYHSKPSQANDPNDSEIPLSVINNVKSEPLPGSDSPKAWSFIIDIGVREFLFKVGDKNTANMWMYRILETRNFYLNKILGRVKPLTVDQSLSKTKFWKSKSPKAGESKKFFSSKNNMPKISGTNYEPFTAKEVSLIKELDPLILSDKRILKQLLITFFDRLSNVNKKDANDKSKQLGVALSMWMALGEKISGNLGSVASRLGILKEDTESSFDTESVRILKSLTPNEAIKISMAVALSRELKQSCDTHKLKRKSVDVEVPPYYAAGPANDPSTPSKASTIPDFDGQDQPFRSDSPEALFIVNYLRSILQISGVLGQWLAQIILTTASNPDSYVFQNNISLKVPSNMGGPGNEEDNTLVTIKNPNFSPGGVTNNRYSLHLLQKSTKSFAHPNDSIFFLIIRACFIIVQKIHAFKINLPLPLVIFVRTLKALTVGLDYQFSTQENFDSVQSPPSATVLNGLYGPNSASASPLTGVNLFRSLPNSPAETVDVLFDRVFDSPDERAYLKSLSSVLFLRLICPAIISPLEWGSLHHTAKLSAIAMTSNKLSQFGIVQPFPQTDNLSTSSLGSLGSFRISDMKNLSSSDGRAIGSPTAFIVLLALVIGDDSFTERSNSPRASSGLKNIDFVESFAGKNVQQKEGTSSNLYTTAKTIKTKLTQLAETVDQLSLNTILEQYQSLSIELNEDDEEEIKSTGIDLKAIHVQLGLIEVAKVLQKVANMACMGESDMQSFLAADLVWQRKRSTPNSSPSHGSEKARSELKAQNQLTQDEMGKIFTHELTTVSKMLKRLFIDSSIFTDPTQKNSQARISARFISSPSQSMS